MTRLLKLALVACLLHATASTASELDHLPMNGIAAFEQLRLEYFIGAILTPSPTANADNLQAQAGPMRMSLRITADRWPAMRFAQQWNQLILINNDSRVLNANLMDVLAFTSFLKEDLIAGDHLAIDLTESDTTLVSLNGTPMMATADPALFRMLMRTWIGPRPPSSEFKRDMLTMPTEAAGSALIARYEATQPAAERVAKAKSWAMPAQVAVAEPAPAAAPVAVAAAQATDALVSMSPPDDSSVRSRPAPVIAAPALPEPAPAAVVATAKPAIEAAPAPVAAPAVAQPAPAVATTPEPAAMQVAATRLDEIAPTTRPLDPALQLKVALDSYNNRMRGLVYRHINYPQKAITRNIEGLVVVRARLARNGTLLHAEIAQSADRLLDKAAMRAMEKAAPFPVIEELPEGAEHTFIVPMIFKLDE